jgi:hypothetical protein
VIEVGIIVNPASGKDIRRIIANGTVVTNQEKINMVVRMIMAMDALCVDLVTILPDPTHIGQRVIDQVVRHLRHCRVEILAMPQVVGTARDSLLGSEMMRQRGVSCMLVLGGDGTSRVVSRTSGRVPLLPISTGTNNVFPRMVEGTLAGMAAAQIALGRVSNEQGCRQVPRLELLDDQGDLVDIALVDLAVIDARDLGSRAVLEHDTIRELFLTTASPSNIGLSSIGGWLCPLVSGPDGERQALHIELGPDGEIKVLAPIAPGTMREVRVRRYARFGRGESIPVSSALGVIALDGEREVRIGKDVRLSVRLNPEGPMIVDLDRTLDHAAQQTWIDTDGKRNPES